MIKPKKSPQTLNGENSKKDFRNASLGDHDIFFYASSREKYETLFSNLKAGMRGGYSALYIASRENVAQIRAEMRNFGLELDNPERLKIVTSTQWYTPDGEFNADRVINQHKSLIDESIDRGLEGGIVSADVADTFDYLSNNLTVAG